MSPIRKEALVRLGFIVISIAVIVLIGNDKGTIRYLAAVLVLFILYHFIRLIRKSLDLINDLFPVVPKQKSQNSSVNKAIYYSSTAFLFIALISCIFEVKAMGNTVHGLNFFIKYALLGIITYVCLIVLLKWKFSDVFYDSNRRFTIYLANLISLFIFVPSIACFININWTDPDTKCQIYRINSRGKGHGKTPPFLWITVDQKEERFQLTREEYDMLEADGDVRLCIGHGKLGYDFVYKFLLPQ